LICCANAIDVRGGVIYFDITDLDIDGYNKFYSLHAVPGRALYGERARFAHARENLDRLKSLDPDAAEDNLASLAEQYGGGGHPRVAAISLDPNEIERRGNKSPRKLRKNCGIDRRTRSPYVSGGAPWKIFQS